MRCIAQLKSRHEAEVIHNFLFVQGINNDVEIEDSVYSLWIHDDEQLEIAQKFLEEFQKNPNNVIFFEKAKKASVLRADLHRQEKKSRNNFVDLRTHWHKGRSSKSGPVTLALIVISVIIALITRLGEDRSIVSLLSITGMQISGNYLEWAQGFQEIGRGQVWRLITPIFVHFGFLHLLFNMLWLRDLGSMIEKHSSGILLILQVLIIGALSNIAQYYVSGPSFGGMSGVVYGLLGYVWIRGKYDPGSGLFLHKSTVIWMIAWFFLCLTGLIGNVANTAHGVGLVLGMIWGFAAATLRRN